LRGSPDTNHLPGGKIHFIGVAATCGNSVKVAQFCGKTTDMVTLPAFAAVDIHPNMSRNVAEEM